MQWETCQHCGSQYKTFTTHFAYADDEKTACGHDIIRRVNGIGAIVRPSLVTESLDPWRVDCKQCRNTKQFKLYTQMACV